MTGEEKMSRALGWVLVVVIVILAGAAVGSGYFLIQLVRAAAGLQ